MIISSLRRNFIKHLIENFQFEIHIFLLLRASRKISTLKITSDMVI